MKLLWTCWLFSETERFVKDENNTSNWITIWFLFIPIFIWDDWAGFNCSRCKNFEEK